MDIIPQFTEIILLIQNARNKAIQSVNAQLIDLYWQIGQHISNRVNSEKWGKGIVQQLAIFIQQHHPDLRGYSDKNLWRMKQFYESYVDNVKLSALLREISWSHNLIILSRTKTIEEKEFYIKLSIKEKYTTRQLERQINSAVFERTMIGNKQLPMSIKNLHPDSINVFKDNYVFDFLNLPAEHAENEVQKGLIQQIKKFILELGKDFLFISDEYRVQVGNSDFFIDILLFNRELQCLVAIEIKSEKFKPAHLGQLNFYLEALDRDVKKPNENPSIGILLCKDKDNEVVEYALNRNLSPTMVAEYQTKLPNKQLLQQKLHELLE